MLFHPPNDTTALAVELVGRRIPPHRAVTTGTTPLSGVGLHADTVWISVFVHLFSIKMALWYAPFS
ncbi:MAG: hypothetical protein A3I74_04250 [Candidatus Magasanikbacteria bacterium RIFCSPLOWO2_02_FULL_47_16]|nr:MAG: hypothetical protein A3I74_04250 [Candidatus Magasanikbacteria bacterium RIFCSPLOWO2_02_FULL_47_16]